MSLVLSLVLGVASMVPQDPSTRSDAAPLESKIVEVTVFGGSASVKRTAELLGMQRSNLYKKIEKYGLKKPGK